MKIEIGKYVKQLEGFSSFVPSPFPPKGIFELPQNLLTKADEARGLIGNLNGITHTLPDIDFFLNMFVKKDATPSAQIEGTKATIVDAIEKDAGVETKETDAEDILYYIKALNHGTKRLDDFPLSLRLIQEIHGKLMTDARATQPANPGEFRIKQNWISGTSPLNALFVPPSVDDMNRSLGDFENFLRDEKKFLPLIHIGLTHAQFEAIHPFLDGNGRTGRLLITILLCHRKLLERPVLFLSSYFKKHQKVYYSRLNGYHEGEVVAWLDFFLDGVIEIANDSIRISKEIRKIRDDDMAKVQSLAKRESESGVLVLSNLFANPIVSTRIIMEWTGFTRAGAQGVIDRFINLGILQLKEEKEIYDRTYVYLKYLDAFLK